jgi:membrane-associated phospholipid phosphatase
MMRSRSPSRSAERRANHYRSTTGPSPRMLNILTRISPIKTSADLPSLPAAPSSPVGSSSSRSSSRSTASWRRGRKNSVSPLSHPEVDSLTALKTSFNPLDTVRFLRHRRWRVLDAQYFALVGLVIFSLSVAPSAPLIKMAAFLAGALLMLVPATGQFFFPGLPIWSYLIYFFCSKYIPVAWRPPVSVKILPSLENIIFGTSISHFLSEHTHPVLDILAWLPYGIGHFAMPAVVSLVFFLFSAPGTTPTYARAFGWMSVLGVTIAIVFPTTPPWYETLHGLDTPAEYGMGGSPAGLARIDALFGIDMYTTNFSTNPLPFGAFPSLHGGNALLQALFISHAFPRLRWFAFGYVCWIWWATMYLGHHYAVDLIGGGFIAIVFFLVARRWWLPRAQHDKPTRWDYTYVEIGSRRAVHDVEAASGGSRYAPLRSGSASGNAIGLKSLHRTSSDSSRSIGGSSSSAWSASRLGSSSSSGSSSPSLSEEEKYSDKYAEV